jgi:HlyD family secretion protein
VIEEGKKKYVFNVEKKVARKLTVTVGVGNELFTEIKSGLKPGDRVILNPKDLEDGQPVRAAGGERI